MSTQAETTKSITVHNTRKKKDTHNDSVQLISEVKSLVRLIASVAANLLLIIRVTLCLYSDLEQRRDKQTTAH